ncbi:hypothetical protein SBOR_3976 [Sclerotinia borealis F-4128]|uniref:2EXR domain-containing protein n=1 Tax=Sclerotinia borealis (strain F-4128) TaxID=1432307 RepID=W9CI14_SCLBF|nr:hypothetical protein SBOR_3976 [Sclerotinia borealis F-4128]
MTGKGVQDGSLATSEKRKGDEIEHHCVAEPNCHHDIHCRCTIHHNQPVHKQSSSTHDRATPQAANIQGSRVQRFVSRSNLVRMPHLHQSLGLRRMKKSSNLAGLIKADVEPYCQTTTRISNDSDFPQFADFPVELRLKIWKEYLENMGPRDVPVWRVRKSHTDIYANVSTTLKFKIYNPDGSLVKWFPLKDGLQSQYNFKWVCPQPDVLFINSEARQIGLKYYTQQSLYGTTCSKMSYEPGSETGASTIYRHINGKDRIMPMFDLSNAHDNFWIEHEHQLEGRIALNAFLYDLDPNQPVIPPAGLFMPTTDPFIARERRQRREIEVARAWAAVVPSTALSPSSRTIGYSHPFHIKEVTIYYRTNSLIGIKGIFPLSPKSSITNSFHLDFSWGTIEKKHLNDYEGCQAMRNMERAIKTAYRYWDMQRYRHWVHYTKHMQPDTLAGLVAALSTPETQIKLPRTEHLLLTMTAKSPLLQQKYAARMAHKIAFPRGHWPQRLEDTWEVKIPILPKIQFAICRVANPGMAGMVRPAGYKLL